MKCLACGMEFSDDRGKCPTCEFPVIGLADGSEESREQILEIAAKYNEKHGIKFKAFIDEKMSEIDDICLRMEDQEKYLQGMIEYIKRSCDHIYSMVHSAIKEIDWSVEDYQKKIESLQGSFIGTIAIYYGKESRESYKTINEMNVRITKLKESVQRMSELKTDIEDSLHLLTKSAED